MGVGVEYKDLAAILGLVFLEGALSVDNAVVLATMVRHLPPSLRKKALTYGVIGAFGFRLIALFFLTTLLKIVWLKIVGGAYLVYLAVKHFLIADEPNLGSASPAAFWKVVVAIELTDIAFSADSILSAVAVSEKLWVIVIGGCMGIIMMRVAASVCVSLLDRYPWLTHFAYCLVGAAGAKMCIGG